MKKNVVHSLHLVLQQSLYTLKYHEKTAKRKSVNFLLNILCG